MSKHYDVHKFVERYFPDARLTANGTEYVTVCPWHEGHKRKLYISATHGMYNCFSCGIHGSFFSLVRRVLILNKNKDVFDALKVYESGNTAFYLTDDPEEPLVPVSGDSQVLDYPEGYFPLYTDEPLGETGKKALQYLNNRNITPEQIAYYKLGFCVGGKYDKRIFVPVLNEQDQLVSFVARDFTGLVPAKVLTPTAAKGTSGIKDYVFNIHNAKHTREFIIGEGVFDAIALGVSGIALFGKEATEKQIQQILLAKPLKIVVCLDADAQKENNKLALRLSTFNSNVYTVTLPYGDPASVTKAELKEALSSMRKLNSFGEVV